MNDIEPDSRAIRSGVEVKLLGVDGESLGEGKIEVKDGRARATVPITRRGFPVDFMLGGIRYPLRTAGGDYLPQSTKMASVCIDFGSPPAIDPAHRVLIAYTNHRGERGIREIEPTSIRFGTSPWHQEPQWLLRAWDCSKDCEREFAMKDIHEWGKG